VFFGTSPVLRSVMPRFQRRRMRTAPRRFRSACADVDLGAPPAAALPVVRTSAAAATAKLTEWITRAVSAGACQPWGSAAGPRCGLRLHL